MNAKIIQDEDSIMFRGSKEGALITDIILKGYDTHIMLLKSFIPENKKEEYLKKIKIVKGSFISENLSNVPEEVFQALLKIVENIFSSYLPDDLNNL